MNNTQIAFYSNEQRIAHIRAFLDLSDNYHSEEFTKAKIKEDVRNFITQHKLIPSKKLLNSQHLKAVAIVNYYEALGKKHLINFNNIEQMKKCFVSNQFGRIEDLMAKRENGSFHERYIEFVEIFYEIPSLSNGNHNPEKTEDKIEDLNSQLSVDHFNKKLRSYYINTFKLQKNLSKSQDENFGLRFSIREYQLNKAIINFSESEDEYRKKQVNIYRIGTNVNFHEKQLDQFLSNGHISLLTGTPNTGKEQLAKWMCYKWANNENSKSASPIFIQIDSETDLSDKYWIENQIINNYLKNTSSRDISPFLTYSQKFRLIINGVDVLSIDKQQELFYKLKRINQTNCVLITRTDSNVYRHYKFANILRLFSQNCTNEKEHLNQEPNGGFVYEKTQTNIQYESAQANYDTDNHQSKFIPFIQLAYHMQINQMTEIYGVSNDKYDKCTSLLSKSGLGIKSIIPKTEKYQFYFTSIKIQEYLSARLAGNYITPKQFLNLSHHPYFLEFQKMILGYIDFKNDVDFYSQIYPQLVNWYQQNISTHKYLIFVLFSQIRLDNYKYNYDSFDIEYYMQALVQAYVKSYCDPNWHFHLFESIACTHERLIQIGDSKSLAYLINCITKELVSCYIDIVDEVNDQKITKLNSILHLIKQRNLHNHIVFLQSFLNHLEELVTHMSKSFGLLDLHGYSPNKFFNSNFWSLLNCLSRIDTEQIMNFQKFARNLNSSNSNNCYRYNWINSIANHFNRFDFMSLRCKQIVKRMQIKSIDIKHQILYENELLSLIHRMAVDSHAYSEKDRNYLKKQLIEYSEAIRSSKWENLKNSNYIYEVYRVFLISNICCVDTSIYFLKVTGELNAHLFSNEQIEEFFSKIAHHKLLLQKAFYHVAVSKQIPYHHLEEFITSLLKSIKEILENKQTGEITDHESYDYFSWLSTITANDPTQWTILEIIWRNTIKEDILFKTEVLPQVIASSNFSLVEIWRMVIRFATNYQLRETIEQILVKDYFYKDPNNVLELMDVWAAYFAHNRNPEKRNNQLLRKASNTLFAAIKKYQFESKIPVRLKHELLSLNNNEPKHNHLDFTINQLYCIIVLKEQMDKISLQKQINIIGSSKKFKHEIIKRFTLDDIHKLKDLFSKEHLEILNKLAEQKLEREAQFNPENFKLNQIKTLI